MLFNPDEKNDSNKDNKFLNFKKYSTLFERITKMKKNIFLKQPKIKNKENEKISSISI